MSHGAVELGAVPVWAPVEPLLGSGVLFQSFCLWFLMAVNRPESDLDEGEELLSLTDSKSEEEREDECEDKCEDVLSA